VQFCGAGARSIIFLQIYESEPHSNFFKFKNFQRYMRKDRSRRRQYIIFRPEPEPDQKFLGTGCDNLRLKKVLCGIIDALVELIFSLIFRYLMVLLNYNSC
jgi:hypothetical protein